MTSAPASTLNGRVSIVTGASRGIGRTLALRLARHGSDIVVNYRSDEKAADLTVRSVQDLGRRAIKVQADVTTAEGVEFLVSTALADLSGVDIVVNNVGEFVFGKLADTTSEQWHQILDSNLSSVHHVCRQAIPIMRRNGWGRIINIGLSPTHLVRGAPNIAAYAIAKTGVLVLTRSLAVELAPYGVTVNCVSPGLIDNGYLSTKQRAWMVKRVPMGRLGRPEDVAEVVAFLATSETSYISGANIAVAGGWDWDDRPTDHDHEVANLFEDTR